MSRIKTKPLPQRFPEMFLLSVYGVCIIGAIITQFNGKRTSEPQSLMWLSGNQGCERNGTG